MHDPQCGRQTLTQRFSQYTTDKLHGISSHELQHALLSKIGVIDAGLERYSQDENRRHQTRILTYA